MNSVTRVHVSFAELCQCVSVSEDRVLSLIVEGIVTPTVGESPDEWEFDSGCVTLVHKAARLHRDLTVEWTDIPLILSLLDEVEQLRSDNAHLRQRLNRFIHDN
ncbi:chaperone modulator CbpM [Halopseudomonas sp.]|jgi:chaperone modulatory protein CbpM|uniref:chaperone modulator CbpM n=1 Tax=Halopseudomonas sp. TaxID=2901191 RepID=UPI0039E43675